LTVRDWGCGLLPIWRIDVIDIEHRDGIVTIAGLVDYANDPEREPDGARFAANDCTSSLSEGRPLGALFF